MLHIYFIVCCPARQSTCCVNVNVIAFCQWFNNRILFFFSYSSSYTIYTVCYECRAKYLCTTVWQTTTRIIVGTWSLEMINSFVAKTSVTLVWPIATVLHLLETVPVSCHTLHVAPLQTACLTVMILCYDSFFWFFTIPHSGRFSSGTSGGRKLRGNSADLDLPGKLTQINLVD